MKTEWINQNDNKSKAEQAVEIMDEVIGRVYLDEDEVLDE